MVCSIRLTLVMQTLLFNLWNAFSKFDFILSFTSSENVLVKSLSKVLFQINSSNSLVRFSFDSFCESCDISLSTPELDFMVK